MQKEMQEPRGGGTSCIDTGGIGETGGAAWAVAVNSLRRNVAGVKLEAVLCLKLEAVC